MINFSVKANTKRVEEFCRTKYDRLINMTWKITNSEIWFSISWGNSNDASYVVYKYHSHIGQDWDEKQAVSPFYGRNRIEILKENCFWRLYTNRKPVRQKTSTTETFKWRMRQSWSLNEESVQYARNCKHFEWNRNLKCETYNIIWWFNMNVAINKNIYVYH